MLSLVPALAASIIASGAALLQGASLKDALPAETLVHSPSLRVLGCVV
jgi:hypothetical protein